MKSRDGQTSRSLRETLIQTMEESIPGWPAVKQQAAFTILRYRFLERWKKPMRTVRPMEPLLGMFIGEAAKDLATVNAYARELRANAVRCVKPDEQASL